MLKMSHNRPHRVAAAFVLALGVGSAGAQQAAIRTESFSLPIAANAGTTEFSIQVPPGEHRIVFGSIRSTAQVDRVDVVRPDGSEFSSAKWDALRLMGSSEAVNREQGDVYRLPNVDGAGAGTWKVRFVGGKAKSGKILGAYTVRPRFELLLPEGLGQAPDGTAGVPMALIVMPSDNGNPVAGLQGVQVSIENSAGTLEAKAMALGSMKTVRGVDIPLPNGQYAAVVTLPRLGVYVLKAEHQFGSTKVTSERKLVITGR